MGGDIKKIMVTMREETRMHAEEEREEDKVRKSASKFLDAWIKNKSSDINRTSYSANVDFNAKKTLFKNVQLHGYEIISCNAIEGDTVGLHVGVTLNIRGKIRKKRILIYAVKIKNEWKIDMGSLLPS
jgi:hypothetical protein